MAKYLSIEVTNRDTNEILARFFYNISITDIKNMENDTDCYDKHERYFRLTVSKKIKNDKSIHHSIPIRVMLKSIDYKDIRKSNPKYRAVEPYGSSSFSRRGNMSEKSAERKLDDKDMALLKTIL